MLADVLRDYYENHAKALASGQRAQISARLWLEYYQGATIEQAAKLDAQTRFHEWLRGKGQSEASIKRILGTGRAAINRAYRRGEIKHAPFIQSVKVKQGKPLGRPMEVSEIQALYQSACPHLRTFMVVMLGTACRPDAALELDWSRVNERLITLNPAGREQTSKYRPVVRTPPTLWKLLQGPLEGPVVCFSGRGVASIKTAWIKARGRAGLPNDVWPYSCRHTAARWMRREGVDAWQVASQLGHKLAGYSTTEIYTSESPDYLSGACAALDKLLLASFLPEASKHP